MEIEAAEANGAHKETSGVSKTEEVPMDAAT